MSVSVLNPIIDGAILAETNAALRAAQGELDAAEVRVTELEQGVLGDLAKTTEQALTDNTAFDLFTIPVPDENGVALEVTAVVFADDGTDHQIVVLKALIVAVNKGGTIVATIGELSDDEVLAQSAATTLALAFAAAEGADNVLNVSITATSSLTPTTFNCQWKAEVLYSTNGDTITKVNADAA